jgi:lysophospholipase L1-like esterase
VLAIVFDKVYIPNIHYDWLNVVPLLATVYIAYALVALDKTCGHLGFVRRRLDDRPGIKKPFGSFFFSPWFRSILFLPLLVMGAEYSLRCISLHRSLQYERQGDLLFTPVPNQEYVEKISLTHSRINDLGLRGGPVDVQGKKVILCLGDSVTFGYGVNDDHTYPVELQKELDRQHPGEYAVLNGGVDAYPVPFEREKFLYLWNRGIHPDLVIVGYSFNEGGIGRVVRGDEKTKEIFASRVRFKNKIRSIALYNLVVENWARASYNRMKKYMVPGTNFRTLSQDDLERYQQSLKDLDNDLSARGVHRLYLLFTGLDGRTMKYGTKGPFQLKFREFAEKEGVPLAVSDTAFPPDQVASGNIHQYFIDQCHMNNNGTEAVARKLAALLSDAKDKPVAAGGF